ncbi:MAG: enoyl-CoA hydratase/isomerase family protein [Rhizobiales bacterium]|nr:enoyl-CoA hydratase/isomerase family protein [Hyphomicrobiales bacterium]
MKLGTTFVNVRLDRDIAHITLNRPPVNAVNRSMYLALADVFDGIAAMPDVRAAVFSGAGKIFCGGNELSEFVDMADSSIEPYLADIQRAYDRMYECEVPVIGAINGPAVGTGLILASLCDYRIGSPKAALGIPEINVGLVGGARHLARLTGEGVARMMAYTGRILKSEEAERVGLLDRIVAPENLMDSAQGLAAEIARKSPPAIRMFKRGLNSYERMGLSEGFRLECELIAASIRTPEGKEGTSAFLEKRQPAYAVRR